MKKFFILTPFPSMVQSVIQESILGKSAKKHLVDFQIKNLFDFVDSPTMRIDDHPLAVVREWF